MKHITDLLKKLFNSHSSQHNSAIRLIKNRKNILQALRNSLADGNVIGLYSRTLGNGMLLVGVEDIRKHKMEDIIILRRYDQSGVLLHTTHLLLSEIQSVCPFETKYCNPAGDDGVTEELVNKRALTF